MSLPASYLVIFVVHQFREYSNNVSNSNKFGRTSAEKGDFMAKIQRGHSAPGKFSGARYTTIKKHTFVSFTVVLSFITLHLLRQSLREVHLKKFIFATHMIFFLAVINI